MKTKLLLSVLMIFGLAAFATAQVGMPGIDMHQRYQQARIHQGVRQGDLSRPEAHRLNQQQRHIRHLKGKAYRDGKCTLKERAGIRQAQKRAHRNIAMKRHNNRNRF